MPYDVEEHVKMLPPSPSPARVEKHPFGDRSKSLVPKFDLNVRSPANINVFAYDLNTYLFRQPARVCSNG
jgi:hypothetical protein